MGDPVPGSTAVAVSAALISLLWVAFRPGKRPVERVFAVFCGSVALAMLRPYAQAPSDWMAWVFVLGGCATCNAYWLVSRALFRGEAGIDRRSLAVAAVTALLIVAYGLLRLTGAGQDLREGVGALLTLASSTLLVLAFFEPFRDWQPAWPADEKRFRLAHATVFGACALSTVVLGTLARADGAWDPSYRLAAATCATAILLHTHIALMWRRRWPAAAGLPDETRDRAAARPPQTPEEIRIADAVRRAFEQEALYRQPELKVADLAAHLGQPEHRISRAITQGLGERNFNQLVNRHRIQDACRALRQHPQRPILDIALDCGFASLGTFNRAFRTLVGCTPSAWRAGEGGARDPAALASFEGKSDV